MSKRLLFVVIFTIVPITVLCAFALTPYGFVAIAYIGDETGWYHVEDYMCDAATPEECEKYIAERQQLRAQKRTAVHSN